MRRDPQRMVRRCWKRLLPAEGETWRRSWQRAELDTVDTGEWARMMDDWLRPPQAAAKHLGVPLHGDLHLDSVTDLDRVTLTVRFSYG